MRASLNQVSNSLIEDKAATPKADPHGSIVAKSVFRAFFRLRGKRSMVLGLISLVYYLILTGNETPRLQLRNLCGAICLQPDRHWLKQAYAWLHVLSDGTVSISPVARPRSTEEPKLITLNTTLTIMRFTLLIISSIIATVMAVPVEGESIVLEKRDAVRTSTLPLVLALT